MPERERLPLQPKQEEKVESRRDFLKKAAIIGGGAILGSEIVDTIQESTKEGSRKEREEQFETFRHVEAFNNLKDLTSLTQFVDPMFTEFKLGKEKNWSGVALSDGRLSNLIRMAESFGAMNSMLFDCAKLAGEVNANSDLIANYLVQNNQAPDLTSAKTEIRKVMDNFIRLDKQYRSFYSDFTAEVGKMENK